MASQTEHIVNYINDVQENYNIFVEDDTIYSCVNTEINSNSEEKNITLLNYNDYIIDESGDKIYGHINKWILDYSQSYDNCRIVSILNLKSIYNKEHITSNITNEKNITIHMLQNGLCTDSVGEDTFVVDQYGNLVVDSVTNKYVVTKSTKFDKNIGHVDFYDGGMTVDQTIEYFDQIEISSEKKLNYNVNDLANDVKEGKGIILSVCSEILWGASREELSDTNTEIIANHAISVIGVVFSEDNTLKGFYICDTGNDNDNDIQYFSVDKIEDAWNVPCYYTGYKTEFAMKVATLTCGKDSNIKKWADDLDATGNNNDNVIKGNDGSNILKGEGGNDVLVGNEGKDTLYGGADDDVLIAGVAKKTNQSGEKEDLTNQELKNLVLASNSEVKINSNNFESEHEDENYLSGDTGKDLLIGDKGEDLLRGGDNDDILIGGKGFDRLFGENNNDVLIAGKVINTINLNSIYSNKANIEENISDYYTYATVQEANAASTENFYNNKNINNNLYGGLGNDLLIGDIGHDILVSGSGSDYVYGGEGRDILCNYEESARLYGGYGKDRYNLGEGTTNIIRDTDNKGEVYIKEYWLRGAEAKYYLGNNVWIKDNIKYLWNEDAEKLFIQKQGESEITTIEDYHYRNKNKYFSISGDIL